MLHNSGPYGPNETPVNMGAPLNISQLSTPMNMVQNLNNLSKMPPQPSPASSGHFGLPNYPTYSNPAMNMSPQLHPFQNYHSLGFQPGYMPQSPPVMQNTSWQNAMLPMGLNMHSDPTQNMLNSPYIDKRLSQTVSSYRDPHYSSKTPLNIPQIPNKLYQKPPEAPQSTPNNFGEHYKPYSAPVEDKKPEISLKSPESLLCDNTRRKNLENTVRLIENILINTTKNREMELSSQLQENNGKSHKSNAVETDFSNNEYKSKESSNFNAQNDSDGDEDEMDDIPDDSDDLESQNDTNENDLQNDSIDHLAKDVSSTKDSDNSEKEVDGGDMGSEDVVPIIEPIKTVNVDEKDEVVNETQTVVVEINPLIKEEPIDVEERPEQVVVKIEEVASWTDTDGMTPFHRDTNGVMRDDVTHENIIDSEASVVEALAVIKKGLETDCYYECPNCCLLFRHPKRFLIHTKWHSFGLINDQRMEVAREKSERRQAQRLERLEHGPKTKLWSCKHCDKVYHAKGSLDSHRQRYHSNRVRECTQCNKTIVGGWHTWKSHQMSHNTEHGYQCTECPKRFKYSHSLSKHRDTHLEKTQKCPECPKKFGSQALLKVHLKSHERARQGASFHCTYCGKSFYDNFNLQIHERKHKNERPFVCEICNATFGCNSNLSRHLKVSHSAAKPHVCSTCNRSFATALIRDRHELRVHGDPDELKYTCKLCPSRYLKLVDLRKHTYKMHPKPKSEKPSK